MSGITVRTVGLESIADRLRDMSKNLDRDAETIVRKVAAQAFSTVSAGFAPENVMYDGVNDVEVDIEEIENGWRISASGNAVMFIEFGTGVYYNGDGSNYPDKPDGVLGIGEYGQGQGSQDYWFFTLPDGAEYSLSAGGEHAMFRVPNGTYKEKVHSFITHGNTAHMVFPRAYEEAQNSLSKIADEVLGK